jgi:uncharacterized repeat protein (TIGR04042 family)
MPAMHYRLAWPDASETTCYSPSLVIHDFFELNARYPMDDFLRRIREATAIASARVEAKFGFACSAALDQLAQIEARAQAFTDQPDAQIAVVFFDTPAP